MISRVKKKRNRRHHVRGSNFQMTSLERVSLQADRLIRHRPIAGQSRISDKGQQTRNGRRSRGKHQRGVVSVRDRPVVVEVTMRRHSHHFVPDFRASLDVRTVCHELKDDTYQPQPVRFLLAGIGTVAALAAEPRYELSGRIQLRTPASVSISGAATPFTAATISDAAGRFHFKRLEAGAYTIAVFVPGRGQARTTVEVGPSNADSRKHVEFTLNFKDSDFVFGDVVR